MTGERQLLRGARAPAQPGARSPAPGHLAVVQAFINSHYDLEVEHGAELLASPAALAEWLAGHGLTPTPVAAGRSDLERALWAREALRALARANASGGIPGKEALEQLERAARGAPVEVRFGTDGPHFAAGGGGVPGAVGVLMAHTARAMIDGSWSRLKVCPGKDCDWAFYDHSRNQGGRWCSMSVCGGRAKARAHYRRMRPEAP